MPVRFANHSQLKCIIKIGYGMRAFLGITTSLLLAQTFLSDWVLFCVVAVSGQV